MARKDLNLPNLQELMAMAKRPAPTNQVDFVEATGQGLTLEDTLMKRKQDQASREQALADKIKQLKAQQGFASQLNEPAEKAAFEVDPAEGLKNWYRMRELEAKGKQEKAIKGMEVGSKQTEKASKELENKAARQSETSRQIDKASNVLNTIDKALSQVSPTTAGFGSLLEIIPESGAKDLASTLKTVKANLGLGELQAMKKASPTGASGLGALSNRELTALESTLASLNQKQSPEQLKENLAKIRQHYQNWVEIMKQDMGQSQQPVTQQPAAQPKSLVTPKGISYTVE